MDVPEGWVNAGPPTEIQCVVLPRLDLDPDQCKELGEALGDWCMKEQEANLCAHWTTLGVDDLINGELPQPLAMRTARKKPEGSKDGDQILKEAKRLAALSPEEREEELSEKHGFDPQAYPEVKKQLGEMAFSRVIGLAVSAPRLERKRVVEGLKESIPEDLVEDVLVDGRSWDVI